MKLSNQYACFRRVPYHYANGDLAITSSRDPLKEGRKGKFTDNIHIVLFIELLRPKNRDGDCLYRFQHTILALYTSFHVQNMKLG